MLAAELQLQAIRDIYNICYYTMLFSNVGTELSYLTQAILSDMKCELNPVGELVRLLKDKLPPNHLAWQHIRIEPTVVCINCETELLLDQAAYCPSLNGWLGHNCCVDGSDIEGYYAEVSFT